MKKSTRVLMSLLCMGGMPAMTLAQGLALSPQGQQAWSSRVTVGMDAARARVPVGAWLSDIFFSADTTSHSRPGQGFRASGGVMLGAGSAALGVWSVAGGEGLSRSAVVHLGSVGTTPDAALEGPLAMPYFGIGYSQQANDSAWGLSADLGLVATSAQGGANAARGLLGPHRLDEAVRNLRLQPILQLGMRFRF